MTKVKREEIVTWGNALEDTVRALHRLRVPQEPWELPWIHPTACAGSQGPSHHLSQKQGRQRALGQPHSWVSLGLVTGWDAGLQVVLAQEAQGWAGQGFEDWRPALLTHPGDWHGLLSCGQGGVAPGCGTQTGRADRVSGTQQGPHIKSWTSACPGCPEGQARGSLKDGVLSEPGEPLIFNPTFQQYQSHCHLCPVSSMLVTTAYTVHFGLDSFIATFKPLFFSSALTQPIPPQTL